MISARDQAETAADFSPGRGRAARGFVCHWRPKLEPKLRRSHRRKSGRPPGSGNPANALHSQLPWRRKSRSGFARTPDALPVWSAGSRPTLSGWPQEPGPTPRGVPDSLPRGDAGEIWWPVWWCPEAGVEAHLSAVSTRQEEAAPALPATMQGVPPAPGGWSAHAAEAVDTTEGDPRPQLLVVQTSARSVPGEAAAAELSRGARRMRRRKKQQELYSSESSSDCSGSGPSASAGLEEAPGYKTIEPRPMCHAEPRPAPRRRAVSGVGSPGLFMQAACSDRCGLEPPTAHASGCGALVPRIEAMACSKDHRAEATMRVEPDGAEGQEEAPQEAAGVALQ